LAEEQISVFWVYF